MDCKYNNKQVEKILSNPTLITRKVGLTIGRQVKKRLNQLKSFDNFNQYLTEGGFGKPHPLKGNLSNCYGISITPNYRMVVEPLETELDMDSLKNCRKINIKGVLEYHGDKNEWIIP